MSFAVPKLTNGQLFIGSTGQFPVAASLTAGANITITPGAGTITIAASGGATVPLNLVGVSATAFTVAPAGTDYTFQVDTSVASAVTGLKVTGNASGSGVTLTALGGTNESIILAAKGTGNIGITNGQLLLKPGTAGSPALAFIAATGTGFHLNGATALVFESTGSVLLALAPQVLRVRNDIVLGWSSGDPEAVGTDTAFSRISAGLIGVGTGAAGSFAGSLKLTDLFTNNAAALIKTNTTLTDNAAAQVGTLTNAPTAGNPAKWIAILDNGTTRYIPTWV